MMTTDYEAFLKLMNTHAAVFGKKLDDAQLSLYWALLQDRELADIERRLLIHGRKAKFFPKPRDLRPREIDDERIESNPQQDARMAAAIKFNIQGWQEKLAQDPIGAKLELCAALRARYEIMDDGGQVMAAKIAWLNEREAALRAGSSDLTEDGELW